MALRLELPHKEHVIGAAAENGLNAKVFKKKIEHFKMKQYVCYQPEYDGSDKG